MSTPSPADAFLLAATPEPESDHRGGNLDLADQLLAKHRALLHDNFYAACVLGDPSLVHLHLQNSRAAATTPGGPRNWLPILYLTFSRYLRIPDERHPRASVCAHLLLDHGADPNSFWTSPSQPTYKETALYGAAGIANSAALTEILLLHGADPNDPESLYHAAEFHDNAALKVLLPAITKPDWLSYCMCHKMDMEDQAGLQLFLDHHADPNRLLAGGQQRGQRPLHFAFIRHRTDTIIKILLHGGADPSLPNAAGITPYQLALKLGRLDAAQILLQHGARDDSSPKFRLLAALSTGNAPRAQELMAADPALLASLTAEDHTILIDAAQSGNVPAVRLMLESGFPIELRKPPQSAWDGTPLHHAAWHGRAQVVRLLLEKGANPKLRHAYGGDALSTAIHGAAHADNPDLPAYLATVTLLANLYTPDERAKAAAYAESLSLPALAAAGCLRAFVAGH